jgi:hypothetical protein
MANLLGIFNRALTELGASPVSSPTESTKGATLCRNNYEAVRDEVVAAFPWTCAVQRAELAMLSSAPPWGWAYQYQLPGDVARVLEVYPDAPHAIEGTALLTDQETVSIRYIAKVTDPALFDAPLAEAISYKLAAVCAYSLTNNPSLKKIMEELYAMRLRGAEAADVTEGYTDDTEEDPWLTARR